MPGVRPDPLLAFRYAIEIDQLVAGGFSSVSGLAFETEVETVREGGSNAAPRQLPGAVKAGGRIALQRGLGDGTALWDWFVDVTRGVVRRRDLSVLLLDEQQHELRRWKLSRACPVRWVGPSLRGQASEVAIESIEFLHEGLHP